MDKQGKILGLDVGEKTFGCAVSGKDGIAIEPLPAIVRHNGALSLGPLKRIISSHAIDTIVVGVPLRRGHHTHQSHKVRGFISKFKKHFPKITVKTQDETLSTWSVQMDFSHLRLKKLPKSQSPLNIDSFAAKEILKDYFQSQENIYD